MQIEAISVFQVKVPLLYPFRTAFDNTCEVDAILVKMSSGGKTGWGESAPWKYPAYCPESAEGCFLTATRFIAPLLIGKDIVSGENLQETLSCVKGNQFAKAAFDLAWWDLHARLVDQPLWRVLGGVSPEVEAGADFGIMETHDALLEVMQQAVDHGYKRVKLKYRPGWELDMLDAVRSRFPKLPVHIDCNSAYTLKDIAMFEKADAYGLEMIEQPLMHDDLLDHAELQRAIKTRICLDESITSVDKARKAIKIDACRVINIKTGRVGGITNAVKIHDLAFAANIPCWVGSMLDSAVGAGHLIAMATLPGIKYPSDIFPTDRFFAKDLGRPPMVHSSPSCFRASDEPGIGAAPDFEMLTACTVNLKHFDAVKLDR